MKAALTKKGLQKKKEEEEAEAEQDPLVKPEGLQEGEEEEPLADDAELAVEETQPVDVEWPIRHRTGWPEAIACVKKNVCEDM